MRTSDAEKAVKIDARIKRPEDSLRRSSWPDARTARRWRLAQLADGRRPEEIDNLALFNGQRTLVLDVRKSQARTPSRWSTA